MAPSKKSRSTAAKIVITEIKDASVPYSPGYFVTYPTALTQHMRTNFFYQLWRFVVINIRMTIMLLKSH